MTIFTAESATPRPNFLKAKNAPPRYRFRLMEMFEPSERLSVITRFNPNFEESFNRWFVDPLKYTGSERPVRVVAENVIALVILPRLSPRDDEKGLALVQNNTPPYAYYYDTRRDPGIPFQVDTGTTRIKGDSYNRLPPCLQVVMVAIDEPSALRLEATYRDQPPALGLDQLFKTADKLDADIEELEKVLSAKEGNLTGNKVKVNYRVFKTLMVMRSAR